MGARIIHRCALYMGKYSMVYNLYFKESEGLIVEFV